MWSLKVSKILKQMAQLSEWLILNLIGANIEIYLPICLHWGIILGCVIHFGNRNIGSGGRSCIQILFLPHTCWKTSGRQLNFFASVSSCVAMEIINPTLWLSCENSRIKCLLQKLVQYQQIVLLYYIAI